MPEVETIRRQLEPELVGRRIERASVLDERLTRPEPPKSVERAVSGRRVEAVERRGKYLLIRLEGGRTLAMHLRMTGNLLVEERQLGGERLYGVNADDGHLRALISLDGGAELRFVDTRHENAAARH